MFSNHSYEATTEGGGKHSREVILDGKCVCVCVCVSDKRMKVRENRSFFPSSPESDPLWVELRHKFISDVIG